MDSEKENLSSPEEKEAGVSDTGPLKSYDDVGDDAKKKFEDLQFGANNGAAKLTELINEADKEEAELEEAKRAIIGDDAPDEQTVSAPVKKSERPEGFAGVVHDIMKRIKRIRRRRLAEKQERQAYESAREQKHSSAQGRRGKKKKAVRYDRIAVLVLALALLIFLLVLIIKGIAALFGGKSEGGSETTVQTTVATTVPDNSLKYKTETKKYSDIQQGMLLLVNESVPYSFPASMENENVTVFQNKNKSYMVGDNSTMLNKSALEHFNEMMKAFEAEKKLTNIIVTQGYRTKEYQEMLYGNGSSNVKGGFTEHHTGYAFNISIFTAPSGYEPYNPRDEYAWIADNCAKYGFIQRYPSDKAELTGNAGEPSHFRYVGTANASYMKKNSLCFEEYLALLKEKHPFVSPLVYKCEDNNIEYMIYYTEASLTGDTAVNVPQNAEYTVSGNNTDGFIVTVALKDGQKAPAVTTAPTETTTGTGTASQTTASVTTAPAE